MLLFLSVPPLRAGDHGSVREYTKSINRRFPVASVGELVLDNQHGDIDLTFWDKQEVRVAVTIIVEANSEQRARGIFDRVDVSFASSGDRVEARTVLSGSNSRWGGSGTNTELRINYVVQAPVGFTPELTNRYGATRVADISTDARFDVSYGSLDVGDIDGATQLELAYGQATLGELGDLVAEVSYSQFVAERATDVRVDARYSQLDLAKGDELALESRYGEYKLGTVRALTNDGRYDAFTIDSVGSLGIESRYTNISVNHLADVAELRLHYGSAEIRGVAPGFVRLDLVGDYTDFDIRLGDAVPFTLRGEGRYVDFQLPSYFTRLRREVLGTTSTFEGQHGEGEVGEVIVQADHGSVYIR